MERPEYDLVERPLVEQLKAMGWAHLEGAPPGQPAHEAVRSGRRAFTEVVYRDRFREAVRRINSGPDGEPWLTGPQLDHALGIVLGTVPGHTQRGVAGNHAVTDLLRDGLPARRLPDWHKALPETVRLVDWDGTSERGNDLLAVSQFRVDRRGSTPVTPDLVLFVNGLPWVVIEGKAPARGALDTAVEQVIGYAGPGAESPVAEFVRFAQVLIATDREGALLGSVTAGPEDFAPWRTVAPATEEQVRREVSKPDGHGLTPQEVLAAGVLRPAHLLDLVRDFTVQTGKEPRTAKVIARYPQFRAVHELTRSLTARKGAVDAGRDPGHRAGLVWHTQGSGKSLTMAFLVRRLRSDPTLSGYKVVVVTDRIDLERQIRSSLRGASGEEPHRAPGVNEARRYLEVDVADLVLVTIQKARRDGDADDGTEERLSEDPEVQRLHNRVANVSHDIVVLVDEAHRSHAGWQHARLRAMLPNAAMVGFTGTPILSGDTRHTRDVFGGFADTYTLRDAEADGAVVPVRYEAHSVPMEVVEKAVLDARFVEEVPAEPEQRRRVLRRFARRREVLEAPGVIAAKADHMLRHWAKTALPDGFGAQVVAVSRRAAVGYRDALHTARDRLLAELDAIDPDVAHDPMAHEYVTEEQRQLLYLLSSRHLLASIEAAVVISDVRSRTKDPKEWGRWKAKGRQRAVIRRFKEGIDSVTPVPPEPWEADTHADLSQDPGTGFGGTAFGEAWHQDKPATDDQADGGTDDDTAPLAFLVVKSMLLTGFDAPVEQVIYIDRPISGVELLQAVARTNRPYPAKEWGQVVDYIGVGPELGRALSEYDRAHLREVFGYREPGADHLREDYEGEQPTADRILLQTDAAADDLLRDLHHRITVFLEGVGVDSLAGEDRRENLLAALADPLLRAEFDELVRDFLTALNAVLPRPKALEYEDVARRLGEVQYLARRRYLDGHDQFSPRRYGAKVRALIAKHLQVTGIEERIPPVEITAPGFMDRVGANTDPRARASYLEGSLRLYITARLSSDPQTFDRFSARLEEIVRAMSEDFELAAAALAELAEDVTTVHTRPASDVPGLEPWTEQPVYLLLKQALEDAGLPFEGESVDLVAATRGITVEIAELVRPPQFATLPTARDGARKQLRQFLEQRTRLEWGATAPLASRLVELAEQSREEFLRYGGHGAT